MSFPRINMNPAALVGGVVKTLFIGAVLVALAPPLRQRAAPHVEPALNPIRRLTVQDEVTRVSAFVERDARVTGVTPLGRDLPRVLRKMFPGRDDALRDPWGTHYFLRRRGDGFHVGSAGPDRRHGTADDILSPKRLLPSAHGSGLSF